MTVWIWSETDRPLVTVTPRIFNASTRWISLRLDGTSKLCVISVNFANRNKFFNALSCVNLIALFLQPFLTIEQSSCRHGLAEISYICRTFCAELIFAVYFLSCTRSKPTAVGLSYLFSYENILAKVGGDKPAYCLYWIQMAMEFRKILALSTKLIFAVYKNWYKVGSTQLLQRLQRCGLMCTSTSQQAYWQLSHPSRQVYRLAKDKREPIWALAVSIVCLARLAPWIRESQQR